MISQPKRQWVVNSVNCGKLEMHTQAKLGNHHLGPGHFTSMLSQYNPI